MVSFVIFWKEDPTLLCNEEIQLLMFVWKPWTLKPKKKDYFKSLEETLKQHNLMNCPGQIYNVDEMGVPLDHRPPNVIARRWQEKVCYRVSGNKKQVTVVGCINAAGQSIPLFVIFDAKCLNHDWTD